MLDAVRDVLQDTVSPRSRTIVGALVLALLAVQAAMPLTVTAQDPTLPAEQSPRVTLTCINARATIEGHVHLVGGRGRPPRYLVMAPLACDGTSEHWAETTTIWWPGSIWHVAITVESGSESITCEEEGTQLPAQVRCSTTTGEVVFVIEAGPAESDDATVRRAPPGEAIAP